MVYVDELRSYSSTQIKPGARRWGRQWCHLWADTEEELHQFAARLGLKRSWFQNHHRRPEFWHYDLVPAKRTQALELGAAFKPSVEHGREIAAKMIP